MSWSNKYVGIPQADHGRSRAGVDCWGLLCVAFWEEHHITLPDYLGYSSPDELEEVSALVDGAKVSPLWVPVEGQAMAFDIALFKRGTFSNHVGLVVKHGLMWWVRIKASSNVMTPGCGRVGLKVIGGTVNWLLNIPFNALFK